MGNPSSGSKVQSTMSLPKGRHRQSLSVGASLEKLAPHEKLRSTAEEKLASCTAFSPRTTEEKSIAAFLGDKKMKRRTRSSLGGSEEFIKGFELNGIAMLAAEDRKPLSSIPFRGQRRAMSGNVTPRAAESPRANVICTLQGAEKNTVAKSASSLFHSPTNLERSMSLSRLAHRTVPDADGSTPRCRTGVLREVVLPGERSTLAESKRQGYQRGVENRLQAAHRSENGSGRRSSSVLLEKKLEGPGARKTRQTAVLYAHDNDENLQQGASMVLSTDSWPNHEQMYWNPAYLPVKDIHPVCFETTTKLRSEQPMTSRSLDMGYDLHGFVRRSSFSTVTSSPLLCSSRGFNPSGPEVASNPTLKAADSLHSEPQRTNVSSTHISNSYWLNHCDVQSTLNSYPGGLETRNSIELQGQPFPITTPSRKQSLLDLNRQDLKNFHCHPLPLPPTSKTSQVNVKDKVGTQKLKQKISVSCFSDKVSEEDPTEAAFLSSFVCEDDPAGPVLISEEPKQSVMNASQEEETVLIREKDVGFRKTSDSGACLKKSTSFESGQEDIARIEHEKKTKPRKRRRSVSASGIGAMLLKVVRVTDTGPLETRSVPVAEFEISKVDLMQSRHSCAQTSTVPSIVQSEAPTTSLSEDVKVETQENSTEALDMDIEYQDCSVELVSSDVDACHKVNAEGTSTNKDTKPPLEGKELPLQIVGDTQETEIKSYAEGSQCDSVVHGSQEVDQNIADSESGTISWNSNNGQDKQEISSIVNRTQVHSGSEALSVFTGNDPNKELLIERILDDAGVLKGLDCDAHQRETSFTSAGFGTKGAHQELEKGTNRQQAVFKNARLSSNSSLVKKQEGPGGSRRKSRQSHQGRANSYDLGSSTDCRSKKPDISEAANTETGEAQTTADDRNNKGQEPLALPDDNVTITRESTRPARSLIVSMLQVSPRQSHEDDYHLAPSSISILANPSFSSSHQDRIWEEQAEAYSSGGRGTPGREDDTATNVFLHSPSPGGAFSSDDQIHSAAHGSLRRGQGDTSARISATCGFVSDNGRGNERRKSGQSKKRGRPRTPLRSLLAEDLQGKTTCNQGRSSESHGHFLQQLMSRIRGNSSSKSSSPTSQEQAAMPRTRRNTFWSSCLCFPH